MSVQAAYTMLEGLSWQLAGGNTRPFGLSVHVLESVLKEAGYYTDERHQYLQDVLLQRKDLTKLGLTLVGGESSFVDVDPSDAFGPLSRGLDYKKEYKRSFAAVITCQAQSICIIFPYKSSEVVLFDSHSRQHSGRSVGASFLFFSSLEDACKYLKVCTVSTSR